jgi:acetyl esterase/lipase
MGKKSREARALLYRLANEGWVCISANYRLRGATTRSDQLLDVKKVLAWVREHGREYGADPAVVFVAGSSAGAHLAALAALTQGEPEFQPGFEGADISVTAAICLTATTAACSSTTSARRRPSSWRTATWTRWSRWLTPARSSYDFGAARRVRLCTRSCRGRSTHSTSSIPFASRPWSTRSMRSPGR